MLLDNYIQFWSNIDLTHIMLTSFVQYDLQEMFEFDSSVVRVVFRLANSRGFESRSIPDDFF